MKKIILAFIGVLILISCQNNTKINLKETFENSTWNKFKTIGFKFQMLKGVQYQTKIKVEYLPQYEYSDLKIQYELISPDGESKLSYYTIPMIDAQGKSLGKSKDGHLVTETIVSKKDFINSVSEYKILIDNVMPKYNTENILSIEVEMESLK